MERNISKADRKKAKKNTMGGLDESQHSERSRVLSMNWSHPENIQKNIITK